MTGQTLTYVRKTSNGTILVRTEKGEDDYMVPRALVEPINAAPKLNPTQRSLVRQLLDNIEGEYESGEYYVYADNLPMASKYYSKFVKVVGSLIKLGLCYWDKAEGDEEVWLVVSREELSSYVN